MFKYSLIVLCILKLVYRSDALELIPEQAKLNYQNPKYVEGFIWTVKRYGRRAPYLFNVGGKLLKSWGNNVTLNLNICEYHNNGYKKGFVFTEKKFCDYLEQTFSGRLVNTYLKQRYPDVKPCPVPAGPLHLQNISTRLEGFPSIMPFSKGRVDFVLHQNINRDLILNGSLFITVKDIL